MEIKTKFDLWQEVWIIVGEKDNERVNWRSRAIQEINVTKYRDDIQISYKFPCCTDMVSEDCVFKTKKEAEIACAERKQRRLSEKLAEVTAYLREIRGEK